MEIKVCHGNNQPIAKSVNKQNSARTFAYANQPRSDSISFSSKIEKTNTKLQAQIDFAKAIMENTENNFPYISPSKTILLSNDKQKTNLQEKLDNMRKEYPSTEKHPLEFAENLIKNLKTTDKNLANCYELTKLMQVALEANGVKNVSTASLLGYINPKFKCTHGLDHTFLVVNGDFDLKKRNVDWDKPKEKYGNNAYIVDPWLGFVDTVENALKTYEKTWKNIPHYNQIVGYGLEEKDSLDLSPKEINKIKSEHKELVLINQ